MSEPKLPELPEPHRTQNVLRCMACKKPYTPARTVCNQSVNMHWACACGCGTFEGLVGYEPQPQYTAGQMHAYGKECARVAVEAERSNCELTPAMLAAAMKVFEESGVVDYVSGADEILIANIYRAIRSA